GQRGQLAGAGGGRLPRGGALEQAPLPRGSLAGPHPHRADPRRLGEAGRMSAWKDVEASEPEFAGLVRRVFDGRRHKTLATLRRDGSPRISGIELEFAHGEVFMGMMPGSLKSADLRRDPRLTVH